MQANRTANPDLALALAAFALCAGLFVTASVGAHEGHHRHQAAAAQGPSAPHDIGAVNVPPVTLVRQDGRQIGLRQELAEHGPVLLAFIYTSCSSVCPVTSQVLSKVQERLGARRDGVKIVSVSIDPEFDTPARLREYAKSLGAGPAWQHFTGSRRDSITVQKAFGAYYGDKMNHQPALFLRKAHSNRWTRMDGFPAPDAVVGELVGG